MMAPGTVGNQQSQPAAECFHCFDVRPQPEVSHSSFCMSEALPRTDALARGEDPDVDLLWGDHWLCRRTVDGSGSARPRAPRQDSVDQHVRCLNTALVLICA